MHLAAIDFEGGFEDAWADVAAFVPKLLAFLAIIAIGYLVATAVARMVDAALERVGFDGAVERGGIRRALESSRYDASDLVGKVVFGTLLLLVLHLAFGVFGPNPVSALIGDVVAFLPKVFVAIVIVVVASAIAAGVKDIVSGALGGLSYGRALANAAAASILVIGVFAALNQIEIAPAIVNGLFYALLAVVAGSAIVAIGGGGIQPMRSRWERALQRIDDEAPRVKEQVQERAQARAAEIDLRTPAPEDSTDVTVTSPARASTAGSEPVAPVVPGSLGDETDVIEDATATGHGF